MRYGPNTQEVKAVIQKINKLTPEQIKALDAAYVCAGLDEANHAAVEALDAAGLDEAWEMAKDCTPWSLRHYVLAVMVKDLITPEQFEVLYGTWRLVMEAGK